eukprot:6472227-Amphidinium_carterae.2
MGLWCDYRKSSGITRSIFCLRALHIYLDTEEHGAVREAAKLCHITWPTHDCPDPPLVSVHLQAK